MSDFVVHFTKPSDDDATGYDPMMRILASQRLTAGSEPFGVGRRECGVTGLHRSVCFSEIPFGHLARLVEHRSPFGIAFSKDFLRKNGGAPVWHLPFESSQHLAVQALMKRAHISEPLEGDPIWSLTPFVDITGKRPDAPYDYQFEWEREWRVPKSELQFHTSDVSVLFVPEHLHLAARQFFLDVKYENSGPAYECILLDGRWDVQKIRAALAVT